MPVKVTTDYLAQQMALYEVKLGATGTNPPLFSAKCALFQGAPALTSAMTVAQLTAAGVLPTYVGYATQSVTWDAVAYRSAAGIYVARGTLPAPFQPTSGATANTITGLFVTDAAAANVLWAEFLDTPLPMTDTFSFINALLYFAYGFGFGVDSISGF